MKDTAKFVEKTNALIAKSASKLSAGETLQALIYSDSNDIDINFSNLLPDQPFHVASIGKIVTASMIGILHDKSLFGIDNPIHTYLEPDVLKNLFVWQGADFSETVTIRHLLGHTSGIADYFESKVNADSPFVDQIMQDPDKMWTPAMLLDFTRTKQSASGPLGTYGYSDTGYVLLGLIIEKVTQLPLDKAYAQYIFEPLGMADSYVMFYGQPQNPAKDIAPVYFNGQEISKKNLLSCDWAGGGIVSTTQDLLKFQKAFWGGKVVSPQFRDLMILIQNKFRAGMHYGMGVMELRFNEFFFLLRGLPKPLGHSGILATHMYYDKEHDLHIILNLGSNKLMVSSIRQIIMIEQLAKKYLKQ